jgi:catecholate siderophore receptor
MTRRGITLIIFFTATLWSHLFAQPQSNSLEGYVADATHAPIPGVRIQAVADGSGIVTSVVSDSGGGFSMPLALGKYQVKISKERFTDAVRSVDIPADGSGVDLQEIVLQPAPVKFSVTVSEGGDHVIPSSSSATKTLTPLQDVPQAITIVTRQQIQDQLMTSIGDVVRYVPGVTAIQGENNRDQLVIRGNSTSADFFLDGVRDDVQFYRDLYNLDRVEALMGPNAMIFGRGGAGGVINRVTKEAGFSPLREITLEGGSYFDKRMTVDLDQPLNSKVAFRLNGMYENSDTFRNYVGIERYGINPTFTIAPNKETRITISYENFRDDRGSDRGIPSFLGRPIDTGVGTFFGNPNLNTVRALVNSGTVTIEHHIGGLIIKNHTSIADYDRGYQNFVPGAVTADGLKDSLSAYNNATQRRNLFNQTDLTYSLRTGRIRHTLLGGIEVGRQLTNNFRNTGFFNNTDTTQLVPLSNPTISTPVTFRQSATDADNHLRTNLAAVYVQDQVELSRYVQVIGGARFDYFDLQYHDNRSGTNLRRIDNLISPRAGVVFKPIAPLSIYASYSVSYLPSSGDQFSSLTVITQQVKPEKFTNYEVGAKWEVSRRLALTTAIYRLDRTNTRSVDPNDATRIVQTGSQRTNGVEIGAHGSLTRAWKIAGGYAYQDAFVTSATTAAKAGAQVGQVPHHTFSLWNNYQFMPKLGAGIGILNRSNMFAAIDDSVVLPSYTRADAAVFYSLTERMRLQVNVENLFDRKYYLNADNNTNISPGSPRAIRVGLVARF